VALSLSPDQPIDATLPLICSLENSQEAHLPGSVIVKYYLSTLTNTTQTRQYPFHFVTAAF